jgi:GNAT superfamily N-acetyltransferase
MGAELTVRRATDADLEQLLGLAEQRRQQYRSYQPQFWQPAEDAVQQQRGYFKRMLDDDQAIVLLAELESELRGFVIARIVTAPPVYNPGGLTCMVDDFAVLEPADWPGAGVALLQGARNWAAEKGAAQLVVVTAHLDQPKRAALRGAQLRLASEWWVGPTAGRPPDCR